MSERLNAVVCCAGANDLCGVLEHSGVSVPCCESTDGALNLAQDGSAVLVLAGGYPEKPTELSADFFDRAAAKRLRLYVEFPAALPGIAVGPVRRAGMERGVVASGFFGPELPARHILVIHGCHFVQIEAACVPTPHVLLAKVAGRDEAVYGFSDVPCLPLLFEHPLGHALVCTSKFSQFVTARYAPLEEWQLVWSRILQWLLPGCPPPRLRWTPVVRPHRARLDPLPPQAARDAVLSGVDWHTHARMLVHASWKEESRPARPDPAWPCGDGENGLMEGVRSEVDHEGRQPVAWGLRSDCNGESALAFALRSRLDGDGRSARIAANLLDWLYFTSGLFVKDPDNPAYGLLAWTPDGAGALYQDNDVKDMLGCMGTAAVLGTDKWDERLLTNILANFRTTGRLGFRGERIEHPDLLRRGWRSFWNAPALRLSPHFEAWTWAAYLWLYDKTHYAPLLDRTRRGLGLMMENYPGGWFWTNGMQQERVRMLLPLAWLLRVEDTAEHRAWLRRIAEDILACQDDCGAIREELGEIAMGYFPPPDSNASYGTNEAPLIQRNGEPVADLLYTCNFAFLGLHEAAAATGDGRYRLMEDKLADFLVRIQARSEARPELDGAWFRAFDFRKWDYLGSNADHGWGAWSVECGWTQGWIPSVLALRELGLSFWELTRASGIAKHMDRVRPALLPDEAVEAAPEIRRIRHDGIGKRVLSFTAPDPRFKGWGAETLVDGVLLEADWACAWLAYVQCDFEAVLDLGAVIPLRQLGLVCMQQVFHGMYLPEEVEFLVSDDNRAFRPVATATPDVQPATEGPLSRTLIANVPEGMRGRYVRVRARNRGVIPQGLLGAGAKAWLMVDEILVNPAEPATIQPEKERRLA